MVLRFFKHCEHVQRTNTQESERLLNCRRQQYHATQHTTMMTTRCCTHLEVVCHALGTNLDNVGVVQILIGKIQVNHCVGIGIVAHQTIDQQQVEFFFERGAYHGQIQIQSLQACIDLEHVTKWADTGIGQLVFAEIDDLDGRVGM